MRLFLRFSNTVLRLECKILSFQTIPESAFCTISPAPRFLFETSFLFFFLIPMTIMIFLYLRMGLRIRKTTSFGKNTAVHGESKQVQSKRAILKMLGKLQNCAFWVLEEHKKIDFLLKISALVIFIS